MTKNFTWGDYTFKGYFTKAGNGFEIGYKFNNKSFFVSNFIDRAEAMKWWTMSNKFMTTFCKTEFFPMNMTFCMNFMTNFMYNHYYNFVKTIVTRHQMTSTKNYKKDFARFTKFRDTYAA